MIKIKWRQITGIVCIRENCDLTLLVAFVDVTDPFIITRCSIESDPIDT